MRSRRLAMGLALSLGAAVAATGGPVANAAVPKPVRLTIETLPTGTREALLDVEFVNAQRGFAVGAYTTLVSTDDGGRTWKRHDLKAPDDAKGDANALTGLSFPDDKHGYVVGGGAGPRVLATSDGGQTWEPRSELPPVQSVVDDPAVARWGGIDDVSFTDADHGHAVVSTNGAVFATADGGRSWTWQGRPEIGQPRRVEFVDRNRGWVVGGVGELAWATDDGGNTWRQQQGEIDPFFGVTQAAFLDLAFPDASHG